MFVPLSWLTAAIGRLCGTAGRCSCSRRTISCPFCQNPERPIARERRQVAARLLRSVRRRTLKASFQAAHVCASRFRRSVPRWASRFILCGVGNSLIEMLQVVAFDPKKLCLPGGKFTNPRVEERVAHNLSGVWKQSRRVVTISGLSCVRQRSSRPSAGIRRLLISAEHCSAGSALSGNRHE